MCNFYFLKLSEFSQPFEFTGFTKPWVFIHSWPLVGHFSLKAWIFIQLCKVFFALSLFLHIISGIPFVVKNGLSEFIFHIITFLYFLPFCIFLLLLNAVIFLIVYLFLSIFSLLLIHSAKIFTHPSYSWFLRTIFYQLHFLVRLCFCFMMQWISSEFHGADMIFFCFWMGVCFITMAFCTTNHCLIDNGCSVNIC